MISRPILALGINVFVESTSSLDLAYRNMVASAFSRICFDVSWVDCLLISNTLDFWNAGKCPACPSGQHLVNTTTCICYGGSSSIIIFLDPSDFILLFRCMSPPVVSLTLQKTLLIGDTIREPLIKCLQVISSCQKASHIVVWWILVCGL